MVTGSEKTDKLLVYSPSAGSVTDEVQNRLHEEFADLGTTPVDVEALAGGLHVILPA